MMKQFLSWVGALSLISSVLGEVRFEDLKDPISWSMSNAKAYAEVSDEALKSQCTKAFGERSEYSIEKVCAFEGCLLEVSRRGGDGFEKFLTGMLADVREGKVADGMHPEGVPEVVIQRHDLEILTALRRLQKRKDPLKIYANLEGNLATIMPRLPSVKVTMTSREAEEPFMVTRGGNYRSGRQARWTVLLWDEEGRLVSPRGQFGMMGGGMFGRGVLGEDTWQTTLQIGAFVDGVLPPGIYKGRTAYQDSISIADLDDPRGLILTFSEPFEFRVQEREIGPLVDRQMIGPLVQGLPKEGQVKLVNGSYPPNGLDWLPRASEAGQLMAQGWGAIPAIVAELKEDSVNGTQRAWGLGILNTISGVMDPTTEGKNLIGSYFRRGSGYRITNSSNGRFSSAGIGMGGTSTSSGGKIDKEAQMALLERWEKLIQSHLGREAGRRLFEHYSGEAKGAIYGDDGNTVQIVFADDSNAMALYLLSRLRGIENVTGFSRGERFQGLEYDQEIELLGVLDQEVHKVEPGDENHWPEEYQKFTLTGVRIGFPFSILQKSEEWETGV